MPDIRFTLSAFEVVLPAALVAVVIVVAASRRYGADAATTTWRVVGVAYTAALISATLFPFQVVIGPYAPAAGEWGDSINVVPLIRLDPRNFLLNIAMTAPLGFLLPVLTRCRSIGAVLVAGFATSVGIEAAQYICLRLFSGGRSSDVDDVVANVLGVAVGYGSLRLIAASWPRLRREVERTRGRTGRGLRSR